MVVYTGGSASVKYGVEALSAFGTAVTGTIPFGLNQKVTNLSISNNRLNFNKLGQVETTGFAYGQQAGSLGVSFVYDDLESHKIFESIYGAISTGKFPSTLAEGQASPRVGSLTTDVSIQMGADYIKRVLSGCVVNSISMSTSIGEPLSGSIDMTFGKEVSSGMLVSASTITKQSSGLQAGEPFTFAHGSFQVSNGSSMVSIGEIQDADVNWTQNAELLYGIGSHYAQSAFKKALDITGKFKTSFKNSTLATHILDQAKDTGNTIELGDVSGVAIELNFVSGTKSMKIELSGVAIGDYSISGIEPVEPIFEDISWKAKTARITVDVI